MSQPDRVPSYRKLQAWQRAIDLLAACYPLAAALPPTERFGMTGQLRRASLSIGLNIAEGYGRGSRADCVRFLAMSRGSANETDSLLQGAVRVGYLRQDQIVEAEGYAFEVISMLTAMMRRPF